MNNGEWAVPSDFHNPRQLMTKYTTAQIYDIDQRPSFFPMRVIERGKQMIFRMDVLGEGTMEMVVESTITGKLNYKGMRLVVQGAQGCLGTK